MFDDVPYRLGASAVRAALRVPPLARRAEVLARVWLRHARTVALLRRYRFDAVIDGGANVGEFAHLARFALPDAELLCVEPNPGCAARLRGDGFRVVEAALWHAEGTLTLRQPARESTSSTVFSAAEDHGAWRVPSTRLDALELRGERVFVKLDLQGAESAALDGMDGLWGRCAGVLLEVSIGADGTYEPLRARLAARGFSERSTLNELVFDGRVAEADKVWIRDDLW